MAQQERFARALSSVARGVSKLQVAEICCGGLTPEQFETLREISAAGDPSMSTLSTSLRVDLSTMSRNISVLQRQGYVSRARHPDNTRVVTVVLTRKGKNALETLRCDEREVIAKVYQRIPAASRAAVVQVLEMVQRVLKPESDETPCCDEPQRMRAVR